MLDHLLASLVTKIIRERQRVVFMPYSESIPKQIIAAYSLQSYLVMLQDTVRLDAYRKVIDAKVRGKTVLEIGTGAHAPLAKACVKAGAKKVYAIEANREAFRRAHQLLKKENLEEKIQLIPGFSTEVDIPTKADVLVQDLIGNIGSSEGMVPFIEDAKKRLLHEHAIFIPEIVHSLVVPVQKPKGATPWLMQLSNILYWWKNPPKKMAIMNFPRTCFKSKPALFEDFVLEKSIDLYPQKSFVFKLEEAGIFNGFLFWIHVAFDKNTRLDCLNGTSWCSVFVPVENIECQSGAQILLETHSDLSGPPKYCLNTRVIQNGKTRVLREIRC